MEVLVFKTNIRRRRNVESIVKHISKLGGIIKWNVDLHDKDKILRIESDNLSPRHVENTLQHVGYYCEELQD